MNKKFLSSILISMFLISNFPAYAETLDSKVFTEDVNTTIAVPKKLENEINNAIISIYGEEKAPEIYKKVMEIAQKAIEERPQELKDEDLKRSDDWYKDEIIYMFYVDQFGVVSPEKPNQFKDTAEMFEYLQDLGVTTLLSFVTKIKFAPPVSSTFVCVAASRYIFSS